MAGWHGSSGTRSALWLAIGGGLVACGGPGLEPPFQDRPTAPGGGSIATGGEFAAGGTLGATGGAMNQSGGDTGAPGGFSPVTGGSTAPPPVRSGGSALTGGSVLDGSAGDAGTGMPPACVELVPAEIPCVFEAPADAVGTLPATAVQVILGQPGAVEATVAEVSDASACAPEGYYVAAPTSELQVVLCPASCVAGGISTVRVSVGCAEPSIPDMDAGL